MQFIFITAFRRVFAAFIFALFCWQPAFAIENEVWISPNGVGSLDVPVTNASAVDIVYGNLVLYPSNIVGTSTYPFRCPNATSLNVVLQSVLTNGYTTIHFMAGTFQVPSNGISPLTGWKLRGAGIDNTILQLSAGTAESSLFNIIGGTGGSTESVEVSDMTIDCNLQNVTVGSGGVMEAVGLNGSQTRISRVKAINWGTVNDNECFVFFINPRFGNTTATNCVIEDCIVTQPAPGATGSGGVTAITIGPNIRSGVARNNMVYNIQTGISGSPVGLRALSVYSTTSHNYVYDVTGSGAVAAYWDTWNFSDGLIADNIFDNVYGGIYWFFEVLNG